MLRIGNIVASAIIAMAVLWWIGVASFPTLAQVGGWAHPKLLAGLSNVVTPIVSNRGGSLVLLYCENPNANVAYIQLFDAATNTAVTIGNTAPTLSFSIPGTQSSGYALSASGIGFGQGIQAAATTTFNGSTAPSSGVDCNAGYL